MHYFSIAQKTINELELKKSRFISILAPVKDEKETEQVLACIRDEYSGATHYCYAYVLREPVLIERCSDAGEPSGTAGKPILEVIKRSELTDIIAVVVRYFGGTLLGAGGLIRAYSESAAAAVSKADRKKYILCRHVRLTVAYTYLGLLQTRLLNQSGLFLQGITYTDTVQIDVMVPEEKVPGFVASAEKITGGSMLRELLESDYIPG